MIDNRHFITLILSLISKLLTAKIECLTYSNQIMSKLLTDHISKSVQIEPAQLAEIVSHFQQMNIHCRRKGVAGIQ